MGSLSADRQERSGSGMRRLRAFVAVVAVMALFGGCAKFQSSRKMDAGPFGENVTIMMGDVSASVRKAFYIKKYIEGPSKDEYEAEWLNLKKTTRGIVLYSTQIVNIAQSSMTERKKANAIAQLLKELVGPVPDSRLVDFHSTRQELNDHIRNIEIQGNMLDALVQAQPVVDQVAAYVDASFERVEAALNRLVRDIDTRMDEQWHSNRENVLSLYALQNRTFRSYALLYQYREGDTAALNALRENDPALKPRLGTDQPVGAQELEAVESEIMARLKNLNAIREQIMPQVERYLNEVRERDELYNQHKETGRKLRLTTMLWARAHRNLSVGIPVPPEIDLYNVLVGSAKKLAPVSLP